MKILALDQAPCLTGVCRVFVDGDGAAHYETLCLKPKTMGAERLSFYRKWLKEELRAGVELVVIEGQAFGKQGNVQPQMELAGVLKLTCFDLGIHCIVVTPSTLKSWAMDNGGADKGDMLNSAREHLSTAIRNADEADAAWLGNIGYHVAAGIAGGTEKREHVLAQVTKPEAQARQEKAAAAKAKKARRQAREAKATLSIAA